MSQQAESATTQLGLFLNPVGQRRVDFQRVCGEQFTRLFLADGCEQAADLLAQQQVDLLVIDLERFDHSLDLAALGALVARRNGAPTLLICPFINAGWLTALMAHGPVDYAIAPLADDALRELIASRFLSRAQCVATTTPKENELRALLAVRTRMQQALAEVDDFGKLADKLCAAMASVPGVVHVSLFDLKGAGDLQLEAQYADNGLDIARILHRSERLLQSPLRHAFPGLLAACSGEIAYLDAPEKAGEPELALSLHEHGIEMVMGLPLQVSPAAPQRGSLCLMFGRREKLSAEQLDTLIALTQMAALGLRMAEMSREGEHLLGRLTHMATTDALTGVANRRHGEGLLEDEIKRARRYKVPVALIGFDIDHFKAINDRYGHPVGDAVLRTVAEVTLSVLRTSDTLVRSGGEEFVIVAPHTSAIDALKMAEKIRLTIATADIPGCDRLTVSLGVAQAGEQESADALTLRVEAAMARAKRAGRNCVELAMQ
jgi:diguanylate cyclase (GGDEF)-like protein